MTSVFSSNETDALQRSVDVDNSLPTPEDQIPEVYEIEKCLAWIERKKIEKVALQFPDDMLCDSTKVAHLIEKHLGRKVYILADSYQVGCCVDKVAVEHVGAHGVIHFGHTCMFLTARFPVLYIFAPLRNSFAVTFMKQLQGKHFGGLLDAFQEKFREPSHPILLAYDLTLAFLIEKIVKTLSLKYTTLVVTRLVVDVGSTKKYEKCGPFCRRKKEKRHSCNVLGHLFCLQATAKDKSPRLVPPLVFFGEDKLTLDNLAIILRGHDCYRCYVKEEGGFTVELRATDERNKFLRRRLFLIEKVREANVIGVVVATLGTEGYLSSAEQVISLVRASGRKCYLIAVGRPTPPKLANFLEIDVFVIIACPESARQFDLRGQYHKPLVTPYEVAVALSRPSDNIGDEKVRRWEKWGGLDFIPDFRDLLPGGSECINPIEEKESNAACETDVSLLSGKIRHFGINQTEISEPQTCSDVAVRDNMPLAVIHQGGGGEFLAGRSWMGLEVDKSENSPSVIVPGRIGTASGYQTEAASLGSGENET